MMGTDCNYYFLTDTALDIWRKGDKEGENRMLNCLDAVYKKDFFNGVIHINGKLDVHRLKDLAEDAWLAAQSSFIEGGRSGKNNTRDRSYVGYFRSIFRNKFFDLYGYELALKKVKEKFARQLSEGEGYTPADLPENKGEQQGVSDLILEMRSVMGELSASCRQLYQWRYQEGWDMVRMAQERSVNEETIKQTFWRCKKKFRKLLEERKVRRK